MADEHSKLSQPPEILRTVLDDPSRSLRVLLKGNSGTQFLDLSVDDQGRLIVAKSDTSAVTSVSGSASSVTVLASNADRLGGVFYNDSSASAYLKLGATASTSSFTIKMATGDYFEIPYGYTGRVDCIWDSATGNMRVTELT